jgi:hypothetical protein
MRHISVSPAQSINDDDKDRTHPQFNYHYELLLGTISTETFIENILRGEAHNFNDVYRKGNLLYNGDSLPTGNTYSVLNRSQTNKGPYQSLPRRFTVDQHVYFDPVPGNSCLLQYRKLIDELSSSDTRKNAQTKLLRISRKVVKTDHNKEDTPEEINFRTQNKCTDPIPLPEEFKLQRINKNGTTVVEDYDATGRFKEPNKTDIIDDRKISICCPDDFQINSKTRPGYKLIYTQNPGAYGYDKLQQVRVNLKADQRQIKPTSSGVKPAPVEYYDPDNGRRIIDYTVAQKPIYFDRHPFSSQTASSRSQSSSSRSQSSSSRSQSSSSRSQSSNPYIKVLGEIPVESENPYVDLAVTKNGSVNATRRGFVNEQYVTVDPHRRKTHSSRST